MIKRIVLAGVWVSDQDVVHEFYVEKLGFEVQMDTIWEMVKDGLKLFLPVQTLL